MELMRCLYCCVFFFTSVHTSALCHTLAVVGTLSIVSMCAKRERKCSCFIE